jgi:Flp pilus assembly protein TadD
VYEELIDKFGGSPLLLNGLAIAKMHQGQYAEAESSLQQALTKVKARKEGRGIGIVFVCMFVCFNVCV